MKSVRSLASWCVDIFLLIAILAVLLLAPTLPVKVGWNLVARILGLPMLSFLEVWACLIFLAALAIISFFLYFGLKDKVRNIRWWRM